MKYLIFDTETTGLPVNSKLPAIRGPDNWPHIVSISWVILDTDTNLTTKKENFIVKPIGWTIPEESARIHGIRMEDVTRYGYDLEFVINVFLKESFDALVAHNMEFDYNVLINAILWDLKMPFPVSLSHIPRHCTMVLSKDICKIPSTFYSGYKSPKLSELYTYAFQKQPSGQLLHSSMYDVFILTEVIQKLDELRRKMNLPTNTVETVEKHESSKENSSILRIRINDV